MMLQPLSPIAHTATAQIQQNFLPMLQSLLPSTLHAVPPEIIWQLMKINATHNKLPQLSAESLAVIDGFVLGQRRV